MIIIRYRPLRCSYKPLLLLAYIKALPWVAIVYSKSRWMDGYVHMIKEVLGRQHRKKSAARYSFAECQYSRLLKVTRLVNTLNSSHLNCKCLPWGTVPNESYHLWAVLLHKWLLWGVADIHEYSFKMPYLPIILINFSWAKSHEYSWISATPQSSHLCSKTAQKW